MAKKGKFFPKKEQEVLPQVAPPEPVPASELILFTASQPIPKGYRSVDTIPCMNGFIWIVRK